MSNFFLVAEADGEIGYGHLEELRAVAASLRERASVAHRIAIGPHGDDADVEWLSSYDDLLLRLASASPAIVVWSVRTSRWRPVWPKVERLESRHVWIDDIAAEYPAVDVLIIPTLEPRKATMDAVPKVFSGSQYFPLDLRGRRDVPPLSQRPQDVLLTLGGADRTHASLPIARALQRTNSTVVIGPSFAHRDALLRLAAECGLQVADRPAGLRDLLLRHRIVISAGGNTLFEAAAAGTPALVAWEDPHEEIQGNAFARKGSARVIGRGKDLDPSDLRDAVMSLLASPAELERMSACGRTVVDGRGASRIADVILDLAGVAV